MATYRTFIIKADIRVSVEEGDLEQNRKQVLQAVDFMTDSLLDDGEIDSVAIEIASCKSALEVYQDRVFKADTVTLSRAEFTVIRAALEHALEQTFQAHRTTDTLITSALETLSPGAANQILGRHMYVAIADAKAQLRAEQQSIDPIHAEITYALGHAQGVEDGATRMLANMYAH